MRHGRVLDGMTGSDRRHPIAIGTKKRRRNSAGAFARPRRGVLAASVLGLAGCASAPVDAPQTMAVKTGALSPEYSSFNAAVLSEAGAVNHSFTASLDPGMRPLTRLESAYTHNLGSQAEQLRVGDSVSSAGMWGASVRYGGMQYGTRTRARSDVIASPELATTGLAVLPTVADALFASVDDQDTSIARQQLSVDRSWRTGRLTASDAFGRSAAVDAPVIEQLRLADPGCSDFSVGAGKVRRDYAITSNQYGPAFANATVSCGAPLGFTIEGHGEYLADDVAALGFGVARRVGPLGTASFAYASSRAEDGTGWLARVGFEHQNDLFSVAVRSRVQSREFREVGSIAPTDPIMQRDLASVGVNVTDAANLSLAYATQTTWTQERTNLIAIQQSLSLGSGSLSMSAGHSLEDNFGSSVFISYKRPFGFSRRKRSTIEEFEPALLDSVALD
jgi:outer membrane usher protein FimD/PapC